MSDSTKSPATLLNHVSAADRARLEAMHARVMAMGAAENQGVDATGELTNFVYEILRMPITSPTDTNGASRNARKHIYIPGQDCPLCGAKIIHTRIERPKAPLVLDEAARAIIEVRLSKQVDRVFGLMGVVQLASRVVGEMDDVDESLYSALLLIEATLEDMAEGLDASEILPHASSKEAVPA